MNQQLQITSSAPTQARDQRADDLLAALGLTRHLLDDPELAIVRRSIDANWLYEARNPKTTAGWNPFRGEIYIASNSLVGQWLDEPTVDLRVVNENDLLLPEFAFLLHDYLHIWATRTIAELRPELGFGHGELDPQRVEEQAFALVVTEAAATVGLDYWELCCRNLGAELDIGSSFARLTVSYQVALEPEYRRYCPDFHAQAPEFFGVIARFYCTGAFPGFGVDALRQSPVTLGWLRHELLYGGSQRRYARQWLRHFAGLAASEGVEFDAAIAIPDWGDAVIDELGARLWAKIKHGDPCPPAAAWDPDAAWRAPQHGPIDFRFTNLAGFADVDAEVERRGVVEASRPQWREQLLHGRLFARADANAMNALVHASDHALVRWAAAQLAAVERSELEPLDMFFLK